MPILSDKFPPTARTWCGTAAWCTLMAGLSYSAAHLPLPWSELLFVPAGLAVVPATLLVASAWVWRGLPSVRPAGPVSGPQRRPIRADVVTPALAPLSSVRAVQGVGAAMVRVAVESGAGRLVIALDEGAPARVVTPPVIAASTSPINGGSALTAGETLGGAA